MQSLAKRPQVELVLDSDLL
uniref:Uncharacterized protein n=1 Tax=Anguilla anguilla TaxID=7936 RepID=A0A0E9PAP7_ANGAN